MTPDVYNKLFPEIPPNYFEKFPNALQKHIPNKINIGIGPFSVKLNIKDLNNDVNTPYLNKPKTSYSINFCYSF